MDISEEVKRLLVVQVSFIRKVHMPNWERKKRNDHAEISLSG